MHPPPRLDRATLKTRLHGRDRFDLLVIGGGATGLGIALEAAQRGWQVALLEAHDFAQGTSSRSTKLLHGGVRYLAQGRLGLVREALHERATLLAQAPHLAQPLPFVMPAYRRWEAPLYGLGLQAYDALAGECSLGRTEWLSNPRVLEALPGVRAHGLHGGVRYWDAQFDDARLAIAMARTAWQHGAALLNHAAVDRLLHDAQGRVAGVQALDADSGERFSVAAGCIVNATGVWVDTLRSLDTAASGPMVVPSQGLHLVVDRHFLGGDHALLLPGTADGRVFFAVPWLGKVLLGTTDTPRDDLPLEPAPFDSETASLLREAGRCLQPAPQRGDVRSAWVGLRPLVRPDGDPRASGSVSREHAVRVAASRLVSVTGGKWTTCRVMAHDVLERCIDAALLPHRPETAPLPLVGAAPHGVALSQPPGEHLYGSEAPLLRALPGADRWLCPGLSEAMVRFAVRHEMARRLDDVLARRSRLLFLHAALAAALVEPVAAVLEEELGRPLPKAERDAFRALARQLGGAVERRHRGSSHAHDATP